MSNNSDIAVTMYESDPVVAALNKVPGFDPLKLMGRRRIPGAEEDERYLDFRYKKLWFRLAHRKGRIRLNKLSVTEQLAIFEAQVYLDQADTVPISSFTATCTKEEAANGKYIEGAQIKAMDQALTDAGFGLQFVPAPVSDTGNAMWQPAVQLTAPQKAAAVQQKTVAVQQKTVAAQQRPAVLQSAAPDKPTQTVQSAQTAQGVQKETPGSVQTGTQKADEKPTVANAQGMQAAAKTHVNAETLPAEQLPVTAEEQSLPVTSDVVAAMSMLSGKAETDTVPAMQKDDKGVQRAAEQETVKAESMPEELPVTPTAAVSNISAAAGPGTPATPDTAVSSAPAATAQTAPAPASDIGQAEKEDKPYTETTPVEEILQFMTLEDAKKVIVPTGTCKGWTLNEVAERRRPSLKFYLSEGYQGKDNILRAAARLVLDDLEQKAG